MRNNIPELLQKITFGSDHFWNPPNVQLPTVSRQKQLAHFHPTLFSFTSGLSPCPPNTVYRSSLLHTNIWRARRQQTVSTISTETVPSIVFLKLYFWLNNNTDVWSLNLFLQIIQKNYKKFALLQIATKFGTLEVDICKWPIIWLVSAPGH